MNPETVEPSFTILMPTYNQANFLAESIGSVLAQTYPNWEAVIVNDGSTDNTREVLDTIVPRDKRFRVFHKENGGVASALNEALERASGEWICWLSTDDLFEPDKLSIHTKAITENRNARFFHSDYSILDDSSGAKQQACAASIQPTKEWALLRLFHSNYINGISVAIHKDVFGRVGRFSDKYPCAQDFEFWLKSGVHYPVYFIDQATSVTRTYTTQITRAFPERGILDSARSCVEFLNQNRFSNLFPWIDLQDPNNIGRVIDSVMETVKAPNSYITIGGGAGALIDRMREWISQEIPGQWWDQIRPQMQNLVAQMQSSPLPAGVLQVFRSILDPFEGYTTCDPFVEMRRHMALSIDHGDLQTATTLCRYLKSYDQAYPDAVDNLRKALLAAGFPESEFHF